MRRCVLRAAVVMLFAAVSASLPGDLEAAARNIVLIVADDHGRDTGAYGNETVRTPHLDSLAAEGTRFELAFCTTASCSPSRATILTGLQGHAHGQYGLQHAVHNFGARSTVRSLPRILEELGYRTARIGKFHVQPEEVFPFGEELKGNAGGARNPVSMAERCRAFIAQESERPFFLYFCPGDTHRSGTVNGERQPSTYATVMGVDRTGWGYGLTSMIRHELGHAVTLWAAPSERYADDTWWMVEGVAEYSLLEECSDGLILVVRTDHTVRSLLFDAVKSIPPERLLGTVINGYRESFFWKQRGDYYYY